MLMKKRLFTFPITALLVLLMVFLTGCGSSSSSNFTGGGETKAGDLVSVTKLSTRSRGEIVTNLGNLSAVVAPLYSVDTYKVVYKTKDAQGSLINVSGLMAVPQKASGATSPRLSNQHGTIFLNAAAPSFNHQAFAGSVIAASLGYIVTEADYIGYGESAGRVHPHTHKETLTGAVIDLLVASKTWLDQQGIKENGQLFLGGYSEGGYATLAVQKKIQEALSNEFTVTASVPAEGAYNILQTAQIAPDETRLTYIFFAYIIKAYDEEYGLNLLSDIIETQYFNVVDTFFDGQHSGQQIAAQLPAPNSTADSFFKRDFLVSFNNGGKPALSDAFEENNVDDFVPTAPTRFFHGRDDQIVAFAPVEQLVLTMQTNGATDVALVECDANGAPTTHANCGVPALLYSAGFFAQFATDL